MGRFIKLFHNVVLRRSSTLAFSVVLTSFLFERVFDVFADKLWEGLNKGKLWKDIQGNYEVKSNVGGQEDVKNIGGKEGTVDVSEGSAENGGRNEGTVDVSEGSAENGGGNGGEENGKPDEDE